MAIKCPRRIYKDFDAKLPYSLKERDGGLYSELKQYFRFATPNVCNAFAIFGENAAHVAADISSALYVDAGYEVHVDILDAISAVHENEDLSAGKRILVDAVVKAEHSCGSNALVIVHHAEELRGEYVRLFDAYLDLFNGIQGRLNYDGKILSAFGAQFLMLFESDEIVEDDEDWTTALTRLWQYDGLQFTTNAAVGRVQFGSVLKPCPTPDACRVLDWRVLFPLPQSIIHNFQLNFSPTDNFVTMGYILVLIFITVLNLWKRRDIIFPVQIDHSNQPNSIKNCLPDSVDLNSIHRSARNVQDPISPVTLQHRYNSRLQCREGSITDDEYYSCDQTISGGNVYYSPYADLDGISEEDIGSDNSE